MTAIAPAADPQSRVFDVEVTIPNADGRLRPGMIGTVAIGAQGAAATSAPRPLVVPLTAIVRSQHGRRSVRGLRGRAAARARTSCAAAPRRARRRHRQRASPSSKACRAGERVVVSGATLLVDGDAVSGVVVTRVQG